MNPSGMRGLGFLAGAIALMAGGALARTDTPISDDDFIKSYNALEPEPWPDATGAKHVHRTRKPRSVVAYERPPYDTEHEKQARANRAQRDKGDSLLAKARRAKGRR